MKMLTSDYDGTFYIDDLDIQKNITSANRFMEKNIFTIATGRSYEDFMKKKEKYKINASYLICNYGATIVKDDTVLQNILIDPKIKKNIVLKLNKEHITFSFACNGLQSRISINEDNVTKIHVCYDSEEITSKMFKEISHEFSNYVNCYYVEDNLGFEIVSKKVNKSKAILFISKIENIKKSDIYTIGNSYSDIDMIKDFNGFSVKNSVEEVKRVSIKCFNSVSELFKEID